MKFKVRHYKGNILESLRKFRRMYPTKKITEAREIRGTLYIEAKAKKEPKSDFDGTPNSFSEGWKALNARYQELVQIGEDTKEIERLGKYINDFTLDNLKKREQAKEFKRLAAKLEKETKSLDDGAKEMAKLINAGKTSYYGLTDQIGEIGILLNESEVVAKQGIEYADIFDRLMDENLIAAHPELSEMRKSLRDILLNAKDELVQMGVFDAPEKKTSPKAMMYRRDPETGKMTMMKEGRFGDFVSSVGDAISSGFKRLANWFTRTFLPEYREEKEAYNYALVEQTQQLDEDIAKWRQILDEYKRR